MSRQVPKREEYHVFSVAETWECQYPKSQVVGIDPHFPSIEKARKLAAEKGINNVELLELALEDMTSQD